MNNKEFVDILSERLHIKPELVQEGINTFSKAMLDVIDENTILSVKNLGTFEVRKRIERVAVNPASQQKMLVPPKLTMNFKASPSLKEKIITD